MVMAWAVAKLALVALVFLVLGHLLYRVLARYRPVRRVVLTYHIILLLAAAFLVVWMGGREFLPDGRTLIPPLEEIDASLTKVFIGAVIFMGTMLLLRLADNVLFGYLLAKHTDIRISGLARAIAVVIALVATLLILLASFGVPIGPFLATSAIGTAIIGLALQDVLGNVIAGIALQAERPFKVGDWVQIGEVEGKVVEMTWRATVLQTLQDDYVILPNSAVAKDKILNFYAPTRLEARRVRVGVEYVAAPGRVKAVLSEATLGAEGVLHEPKPKIRLVDYGDFAITYEIKYWIDRFGRRDDIRDNVMTRIWYLFRRNRITIPFPIRNVFHHRPDPKDRPPVIRRGSDEAKAILREVELLGPLSDEEVALVADRLEVLVFNAGEVLVRQDDPGDSFFIIVDGTVSIRVDNHEVGTLGPRDFFGEMSLLTGRPRAATVVAQADTRVLVIDHPCFESVLRAHPAVAETLAEVLQRIEAENVERLRALGSAPATPPATARSLLGSVLKFFGIQKT